MEQNSINKKTNVYTNHHQRHCVCVRVNWFTFQSMALHICSCLSSMYWYGMVQMYECRQQSIGVEQNTIQYNRAEQKSRALLNENIIVKYKEHILYTALSLPSPYAHILPFSLLPTNLRTREKTMCVNSTKLTYIWRTE